jgi:hypothetical protein
MSGFTQISLPPQYKALFWRSETAHIVEFGLETEPSIPVLGLALVDNLMNTHAERSQHRIQACKPVFLCRALAKQFAKYCPIMTKTAKMKERIVKSI